MKNFVLSIFAIFFVRGVIGVDEKVLVGTPVWFNELFGDGDFELQSKKLIQKHLSSSTEDLIILHETEKKLLELLGQIEVSGFQYGNQYLQLSGITGRNLTDLDSEKFVQHPVNAFHLMKRTSTWLPLLRQHLSNLTDSALKEDIQELLSSFVLPEKKDFIFGASYGLVTLQDYHDFDVKNLSKGILVDKITGEVFQADQVLDSNDLLTIATISKNVYLLSNYVNWLEAALEAAKSEKKSSSTLSKIKKLISQAKKDHDQEILNNGFFHYMVEGDSKTLARTNLEPFDKTLMQTEEYFMRRQIRDAIVKNFSSFDNILPIPSKWKHHGKIGLRISHFLFHQTRRLCNGQNVRPAHLEVDHKCFHVHHGDPYLILGPFKYEKLHKSPEIGIFRDFVSHQTMEDLKSRARGQMRSTPYVVNNLENEQYTRFRTSKVLYLSDRHLKIARKISEKVQLGMRYNLYSEQFASENYQTMNYGIGGTISGHVDSLGDMKGSSENFGGYRITTFMIYLTSVPLGGHTIFPQAGISVKPEAGSALYWFNHDAIKENDSRTFHLGCPVGVGNKWIANKWIKWTAQMWNYPCAVKKKEFSIHIQ